MKRRVGIVIAWVAATVISVLIATAAVGAVRGRVTDTPPAVASPTTTTTSTTVAGTTSTTIDDGSTTSTSPTTSPSSGSSTTTTAIEPSGTTSTTGATTSTTQAATQTEIKTYTTLGGTVTIEVTSDTLRLLGATPNSGFTVSETELSQTRIDIEFTSDDHESKFRAELKDGVLDTDVEEEGD